MGASKSTSLICSVRKDKEVTKQKSRNQYSEEKLNNLQQQQHPIGWSGQTFGNNNYVIQQAGGQHSQAQQDMGSYDAEVCTDPEFQESESDSQENREVVSGLNSFVNSPVIFHNPNNSFPSAPRNKAVLSSSSQVLMNESQVEENPSSQQGEFSNNQSPNRLFIDRNDASVPKKSNTVRFNNNNNVAFFKSQSPGLSNSNERNPDDNASLKIPKASLAESVKMPKKTKHSNNNLQVKSTVNKKGNRTSGALSTQSQRTLKISLKPTLKQSDRHSSNKNDNAEQQDFPNPIYQHKQPVNFEGLMSDCIENSHTKELQYIDTNREIKLQSENPPSEEYDSNMNNTSTPGQSKGNSVDKNQQRQLQENCLVVKLSSQPSNQQLGGMRNHMGICSSNTSQDESLNKVDVSSSRQLSCSSPMKNKPLRIPTMSFGGRKIHRGEQMSELTQLEELKSDKDSDSFGTETDMDDSHISSVANHELKEKAINSKLKGRSATQKYDKPQIRQEVDYQEVNQIKMDDIQTQYNNKVKLDDQPLTSGSFNDEQKYESKSGTFQNNKNRRGSFNYNLLNNNMSTNNSVNSPHSRQDGISRESPNFPRGSGSDLNDSPNVLESSSRTEKEYQNIDLNDACQLKMLNKIPLDKIDERSEQELTYKQKYEQLREFMNQNYSFQQKQNNGKNEQESYYSAFSNELVMCPGTNSKRRSDSPKLVHLKGNDKQLQNFYLVPQNSNEVHCISQCAGYAQIKNKQSQGQIIQRVKTIDKARRSSCNSMLGAANSRTPMNNPKTRSSMICAAEQSEINKTQSQKLQGKNSNLFPPSSIQGSWPNQLCQNQKMQSFALNPDKMFMQIKSAYQNLLSPCRRNIDQIIDSQKNNNRDFNPPQIAIDQVDKSVSKDSDDFMSHKFSSSSEPSRNQQSAHLIQLEQQDQEFYKKLTKVLEENSADADQSSVCNRSLKKLKHFAKEITSVEMLSSKVKKQSKHQLHSKLRCNTGDTDHLTKLTQELMQDNSHEGNHIKSIYVEQSSKFSPRKVPQKNKDTSSPQRSTCMEDCSIKKISTKMTDESNIEFLQHSTQNFDIVRQTSMSDGIPLTQLKESLSVDDQLSKTKQDYEEKKNSRGRASAKSSKQNSDNANVERSSSYKALNVQELCDLPIDQGLPTKIFCSKNALDEVSNRSSPSSILKHQKSQQNDNSPKYMYNHGSQSFKGKSLIRTVKQIVKNSDVQKTPDRAKRLQKLLDLTRQQTILEKLDQTRKAVQASPDKIFTQQLRRVNQSVKEVSRQPTPLSMLEEQIKKNREQIDSKIAKKQRKLREELSDQSLYSRLQQQSNIQVSGKEDQRRSPNNDSTPTSHENVPKILFNENDFQRPISYQDDFTPSNCLIYKPISHSSDHLDQSGIHLSEMTEFKKPLFEKVMIESRDASPIQGTSDNTSYKGNFRNESLDGKTENNSSYFCSACGAKITAENYMHKPGCVNKMTPSNKNIKIPRISGHTTSCLYSKNPNYKNKHVYVQRADQSENFTSQVMFQQQRQPCPNCYIFSSECETQHLMSPTSGEEAAAGIRTPVKPRTTGFMTEQLSQINAQKIQLSEQKTQPKTPQKSYFSKNTGQIFALSTKRSKTQQRSEKHSDGGKNKKTNLWNMEELENDPLITEQQFKMTKKIFERTMRGAFRRSFTFDERKKEQDRLKQEQIGQLKDASNSVLQGGLPSHIQNNEESGGSRPSSAVHKNFFWHKQRTEISDWKGTLSSISRYTMPPQQQIKNKMQADRKNMNKSIVTTSVMSGTENGKKFVNQYQIERHIGQGSYAKVVHAIDRNSEKFVAIKVFQRKRLNNKFKPELLKSIKTEMAIMKKLDHPNVLSLIEIIDDESHHKLYLVTDYIKNGSLARKISKSPGACLSEDLCRKYFRQLIMALEYCHEVANIIHRDIKPDNILVDHNDKIKLADFGVSSQLAEDGEDRIHSNAGTALYNSPEAFLGQQYRGKVNDIWSCGITLYFMAVGKLPFIGDRQRVKRLITQEDPKIPEIYKDRPMGDLIMKLLKKCPEDRIRIPQIKQDPWVTQNGKDPVPTLQELGVEGQKLSPSLSDIDYLWSGLKKPKDNFMFVIKDSSKSINI